MCGMKWHVHSKTLFMDHQSMPVTSRLQLITDRDFMQKMEMVESFIIFTTATIRDMEISYKQLIQIFVALAESQYRGRRFIFRTERFDCSLTWEHIRFLADKPTSWVYENVKIRKRFPLHWPFVTRIHQSSLDFSHKEPVMWSHDVFFVISLNKLLNNS